MNWIITGSGNGLSPARRHASSQTSAAVDPIVPFGANIVETQPECKKSQLLHVNVWEYKYEKINGASTLYDIFIHISFQNGSDIYM